MNEKRTLVMDLEVYRNYFLAAFKAIDTGNHMLFEMYDGQDLDRKTILKILSQYRIVTFNGMHYDMPILSYALVEGILCKQLKEASDNIINNGLRAWQFTTMYGLKSIVSADHIDLKEPVPGVMVSLKLYGARMNSKRLQDLPIEHDALIEPDQRAILRTYCLNDLDTTIDLWNKSKSIISLREDMSETYKMDLRSKSDAQVAEAVICAEVQKIKNEKPVKPVVPEGTVFFYKPPEYLKFKLPLLQNKLAEIVSSAFVINATGGFDMPVALNGATLSIGKSVYRMGIGGLHSSEQSTAHFADDNYVICDNDVTAYYPSLILTNNWAPVHMGKVFVDVYRNIVERRVEAKRKAKMIVKRLKDGDLSDAEVSNLKRLLDVEKTTDSALKVSINGTFGKLGSKYSALYSPDLMIQVTVTGQLALLMLIERLEAEGISIVSANTDGIVSRCHVSKQSLMREVIRQWEQDTGLTTEETKYRALYSRDVNNYLALKLEGGYKSKGTLVPSGLGKNPDYDIVSTAVCEFLDTGVPIAETILRCKDIRKFLRVRTAKGGCRWGDEYLGRVARWYKVVNGANCIQYVANGNKVGGSDASKPLMELPDTFPTDIDYGFYLTEANDLLRELGACN